jgi:DTW domain-containing protein YfiP
MRSTTPKDLANHCRRCYLNEAICLCDVIPCVPSRTEVLIVRHVAELRLTSNTGRFVALALPNSRLLEYGGGPEFDDTELRSDGTVLLYNPGGTASDSLRRPEAGAIRRLVVLDGTFRQARRMYKRIAALRELPELALPPPLVAPVRLRQPPSAHGLSTLEAVAHALALIEGEAIAEPLHALQAELVRRVDTHRGRRRDANGRVVS